MNASNVEYAVEITLCAVDVVAELSDDVEVPIEEAMKRCKKNAKVLVAEQDLENDDCEIIFISKGNKDYGELFKDVQTAASLSDDLVKQLSLFTERQDILNIRPKGIQKIVLMKE